MPSFSLLKRSPFGSRAVADSPTASDDGLDRQQARAAPALPKNHTFPPPTTATNMSNMSNTANTPTNPGTPASPAASGIRTATTRGTSDVAARRLSKRDLIQSLLRPLGGGSRKASPSSGAEPKPPPPAEASGPGTVSPQGPLSPKSPRSPINPNKPLPSPPPPGSEQANGPSPRPILKLNRIMTTLSEDDIEKLFSGAPQYFARNEGHNTGAPHPSVAFPWDEALHIRDLNDHAQIEDKAWGCVTAWPHITRDVRKDALAARNEREKKRAHFYPRCRERPNMLSVQGLEKGTMGYQAMLERPVGDALQEEQFGFDSMGSKARAVVEQRQKLVTAKEGLRHLSEHVILDQLIKNGARYNEERVDKKLATELYNDLFLHLLHPPTRILDHNHPYSLNAQIQALLKALAAPNTWVDFSHVEWRIRLGQILWGTPEGDGVDDGTSIHDADTTDERDEERYWLLLQILLACELLVRLDAITAGEELGVESIPPNDIRRFERDANTCVKWSLMLARAWLENIEIIKEEQPVDHAWTPGAWLASFTGKMILQRRCHRKHLGHPGEVYTMKGRHGERQVDGLMHFARKIRWPDLHVYESRITENAKALNHATPICSPAQTPMSVDSSNSYFSGHPNAVRRKPSWRRRKIEAALHPSGWLSKSYVSGLILPGEGLGHFLMSTLLENDQDAMMKLGPMANLCGGFIYNGKSFWSTACIVGRVLAAGKGAAECMGWVSSDVTPTRLADGWVDIKADELEELKNVGRKSRLWNKTQLEKDSNVLGDTDPAFIYPADFIIPFENSYPEPPPRMHIGLKSLDLLAPVDSANCTPTEELLETPFSDLSRLPEIHTYPASLTFEASENEDEPTKYRVALSYDVQFVTAHPCVPSQYVKFVRSPSSPTIQQIDVSGSRVNGNGIVTSPQRNCDTTTPHVSQTTTTPSLNGSSSSLSSSSSFTAQNLGLASPPTSPRPMAPPTPTTPSRSRSRPMSARLDVITGHPLHKFYTYTVVHLSDLLRRKDSETLQDLLAKTPSARRPSISSPSRNAAPRILVIDCITNFTAMPSRVDTPTSPMAERTSSWPVNGAATAKMHLESRRCQFGSDMEILARAVCAEKGWNALISRRRRCCLACSIREAGALDWKVIIRLD